LFLLSNLVASTIGIATGKTTVDGRPLLFKNKDRTDNYPSDVNFYEGSVSEYSYVFQQNHGQNHEYARMGINTVGFGIVYTTSENLFGAETGLYGSQFSAIALKSCSTIQDFRDLLDSTNGERRIHEHFGIIDSSGNGSLFEVDGYAYIEIPIEDSIGTMANTAKYHPSAGPPAVGSTSPDREARAEFLLTHGPAEGLDFKYFVNEIIKDFSHSQEDEDSMPVGQYFTNPVLSRYKTAAGCAIKGVKPGDNPQIDGCMWLCLSEPSLSVALPFFSNSPDIPDVIRADAAGDGMAGSSDRMRQLIYDYAQGRYSDRYADTYKLMEIRQHVFPIQDSLFTAYDSLLPEWREMDSSTAAQEMQNWMTAMHEWAKYRYDTILEIMNLDNQNSIQPEPFYVFQNYPNPFNQQTVIPFRLSSPGSVVIRLFDINGREILYKKKNRLQAGLNKIILNSEFDFKKNLAGGVYFYQITTYSGSLTRKMVFLP
jgi:hypothetical protein